MTSPTGTRRWWKIVSSLAVLLGLLGILRYADRFVYFHADGYRNIAGILFLVAWPIALVFCSKALGAKVAQKYPGSALRTVLVVPLFVALGVVACLAAPYGLALALVSMLGSAPDEQVPATIISLEERRTGKGCHQRATLSVLGHTKEMCVDQYPASMLHQDRPMSATVRRFSAGFYIDALAPAAAAKTALP